MHDLINKFKMGNYEYKNHLVAIYNAETKSGKFTQWIHWLINEVI